MKPNTFKPAIIINGDVTKEKAKIRKKFGFDEDIRIRTIGVRRRHPIVLITGMDTHKSITVEISKSLGTKFKRFRGVSSKRSMGYITINSIVNGEIVYEKGTRSGGPKEKLGKLL